MKLLSSLLYPIAIARVDDEDKSLGAYIYQFAVLIIANSVRLAPTRKVMSPQRPDLVLSAHVPDVELDFLVGDCLDVEAYRGYGRDVLVELQLVEDSCRSSQQASPEIRQ